MKKYLAEGIGTMFLVLAACGAAVLGAGGGGNAQIGVLGVGICFGLILIVLCYCIGNISGCHVNPAVSFSMLLAGKMSGKDFVGYVVAQLIGATIGAGFLYMFTQMAPDFVFGGITKIDGVVTGTLAANTLQPGATKGMALLAECLLTFLFVLVILGATDEKYGFGKFAGLAIGIALGLVNIVGISVDNCSVNPARSFGPAVFSEGAGAWGDFWIMLVGPLVGAAIAVLCWKAIANTNKNSIE